MHFFKSLLVGAAALATSAYAQKLAFTSVPQSIQGGRSYTIKWSGGDGAATILLRKGDSDNLKTVATLTNSGSGGSFQWSVDNSLVSGSNYALQITAGGQTNYFGPLSIAAAGTPSASSSSASRTSSRSSSTTSSRSSSTTTKTTTTTSTSSHRTTKTETRTSTRTSSSSSTSNTPSNTSSGSAPQDSDNAAANFKGNTALFLGAVAAVAYLA